MGWERVSHPSTLRIVIWPEASRAQSSMGTGPGAGQHGLGLDAPPEFLVQPLDGVCGAGRFPLRRIEAGEGEQPLPGFREAVGDGPTLEAPFAHERLAAGLHLGGGLGVDHVAVILGQLVVQVLRRMAEQVAVLVHGAALDRQLGAPQRGKRGLEPRRAVDDDEVGPRQPAGVEVVEELAPGPRCSPRPCA